MNINLSCAVNQTGYGIASLNILKSLYKNHKIAYFPIGQPFVNNENDHKIILESYTNSQIPDANAPFIKVWHQFDLAQRVGRGKYYALSFFELDSLNEQEKTHLQIPDELFVTSEWAKKVLINNNINSPIHICPLGVDREIFHENYNQNQNNDKYAFLNVGKWEIRKGHDILLELFLKAFPDEQDVELWVCASENTNSYSSKEDLYQWKNMYNHPRIKLFSGVANQIELAHLINLSNCGIYPTRAEGWNMELLESMSMNKPVITTNYSSQTEFCNKSNSFMVEIDKLESAYDGKAFKNQGQWAKIDKNQKDQFIEYMRYCYKNKINDNLEGIKTAKQFSWTNTASIIERCIS
jgi:glycosyltransferase involved in cell wall biosynthesis